MAGVLMQLLLAVVALVTAANAQSFTLGTCPNYQTTAGFTQDYIDKMTSSASGYILSLSSGGADPCQRLIFSPGTQFEYRFIDVANYQRNYTGTYVATPTTFGAAGHIDLNVLPGMLGSNVIGNLRLYPLVANDELVVFISCIQYGLFRVEQVLAFVPFVSSGTASPVDLQVSLVNNKVPLANQMIDVSLNCVPGVVRALAPVPLGLYNFIPNRNNPVRFIPATGAPVEPSNEALSASDDEYTNLIPAEQNPPTGGQRPLRLTNIIPIALNAANSLFPQRFTNNAATSGVAGLANLLTPGSRPQQTSAPVRNAGDYSVLVVSNNETSVPAINEVETSDQVETTAANVVPAMDLTATSTPDTIVAGGIVPVVDPSEASTHDTNVAGSLVPVRDAIATSAADANVAGSLVPVRDATATSSADANVAGSLVPVRDATTTSAVDANVAGSLVPVRDATATSAADANVAGSLVPVKDATVTSAADANVAGSLVPVRDASATSTPDANVAGSFVPVMNPTATTTPNTKVVGNFIPLMDLTTTSTPSTKVAGSFVPVMDLTVTATPSTNVPGSLVPVIDATETSTPDKKVVGSLASVIDEIETSAPVRVATEPSEAPVDETPASSTTGVSEAPPTSPPASSRPPQLLNLVDILNALRRANRLPETSDNDERPLLPLTVQNLANLLPDLNSPLRTNPFLGSQTGSGVRNLITDFNRRRNPFQIQQRQEDVLPTEGKARSGIPQSQIYSTDSIQSTFPEETLVYSRPIDVPIVYRVPVEGSTAHMSAVAPGFMPLMTGFNGAGPVQYNSAFPTIDDLAAAQNFAASPAHSHDYHHRNDGSKIYTKFYP